jgi:hypothetical protein
LTHTIDRQALHCSRTARKTGKQKSRNSPPRKNFSKCNPWTTQTSKQVPQLQRTGKIYNNNNNINGRKLLQNPANEGPYIYRKEIAERSETPRKAKEAKNNNDLLTWLIII